jgi:hypothetical protein
MKKVVIYACIIIVSLIAGYFSHFVIGAIFGNGAAASSVRESISATGKSIGAAIAALDNATAADYNVREYNKRAEEIIGRIRSGQSGIEAGINIISELEQENRRILRQIRESKRN